MLIDISELYILLLAIVALILIQGHNDVRKQKNEIYCCEWVWMEFGMLLRLVGLMNLIVLYLNQSVFSGKSPISNFLKKVRKKNPTKNL